MVLHLQIEWFALSHSSFWLSFSFRFSMLILRPWSSLGILSMSAKPSFTSLIDIFPQIIAAPYATLCNSLDYDTNLVDMLSFTQKQIAKNKLYNIRVNCLRNIAYINKRWFIDSYISILHLQILQNIKICF